MANGSEVEEDLRRVQAGLLSAIELLMTSRDYASLENNLRDLERLVGRHLTTRDGHPASRSQGMALSTVESGISEIVAGIAKSSAPELTNLGKIARQRLRQRYHHAGEQAAAR